MTEHFLVKEGHCLAVFNSTHRVMQAESLLKAAGLEILLIPAPRALATDCGLAIRFERGLTDQLLALLAHQQLLPAYISCLENGAYTRHEVPHP